MTTFESVSQSEVNVVTLWMSSCHDVVVRGNATDHVSNMELTMSVRRDTIHLEAVSFSSVVPCRNLVRNPLAIIPVIRCDVGCNKLYCRFVVVGRSRDGGIITFRMAVIRYVLMPDGSGTKANAFDDRMNESRIRCRSCSQLMDIMVAIVTVLVAAGY